MNSSAEIIEKMLVSACETGADEPCTALQAVREHFAAGGGRVRARICFHAGQALHLPDADSMRIAAVCELLHNASLVQDDLLDRSTLRRGAPCVWLAYGDSIAVCAGDLMLSAAYGLLAGISQPRLIAPALRLVHRRTSEVIFGQAAEGTPKSQNETTMAFYQRLAQAKSASLLSLALELPLLLAGKDALLPLAHSAACDFAIAYQIADDLNDLDQDMQEGSFNLALLLMEHEGIARDTAWLTAAGLAEVKLASAESNARLLPNNCASTMLQHATAQRHSLAAAAFASHSPAESAR